MDFKPNTSDNEFRFKIREILASNWTFQNKVELDQPEKFRVVASMLGRERWLAPHWPIEWGGAELTAYQRYILDEELVAAEVGPIDRIALYLAGPVIYTFGSNAQKKRYLPRILSAEDLWCQGFSEPESGSDVNSIRTSATLVDNHYIVEGEKVWTTRAHLASMMFALVRVKTASRSQHGLTFLLISMRDPNIVVTPIRTIDGRHHFNRVVLNSVKVPADNVVGEVGRGWRNARFLLSKERVMTANAPRSRQALNQLMRWSKGVDFKGRRLVQDDNFLRKYSEIDIELRSLEFTVIRILHEDDQQTADNLALVVKIKGSEIRQKISELAVEALGHQGLHFDRDRNSLTEADVLENDIPISVRDFLFDRSASIAGGTTEIQRNLVAGIALGL